MVSHLAKIEARGTEARRPKSIVACVPLFKRSLLSAVIVQRRPGPFFLFFIVYCGIIVYYTHSGGELLVRCWCCCCCEDLPGTHLSGIASRPFARKIRED